MCSGIQLSPTFLLCSTKYCIRLWHSQTRFDVCLLNYKAVSQAWLSVKIQIWLPGRTFYIHFVTHSITTKMLTCYYNGNFAIMLHIEDLCFSTGQSWAFYGNSTLPSPLPIGKKESRQPVFPWQLLVWSSLHLLSSERPNVVFGPK